MDQVKNWQRIAPQLRQDIKIATSIWSEILQENECVLAYAKGSALKTWDGPVDYVPQISDIDIHYKVDNDLSFNVQRSMQLAATYQQRFYDRCPQALHLPRLQLIDVAELYKSESAIPPLENQVTVLFGREYLKTADELVSDQYLEKIRRIDRQKLIDDQMIMEKLPGWLLDRNHDMELWSIVRRLCWRISPIAPRVLTQFKDNILEIWGWNRSKLLSELVQLQSSLPSQLGNQLSEFVDSYKQYYLAAWKLCNNNFSGIDNYHRVISAAVKIFEAIGEIDFP